MPLPFFVQSILGTSALFSFFSLFSSHCADSVQGFSRVESSYLKSKIKKSNARKKSKFKKMGSSSSSKAVSPTSSIPMKILTNKNTQATMKGGSKKSPSSRPSLDIMNLVVQTEANKKKASSSQSKGAASAAAVAGSSSLSSTTGGPSSGSSSSSSSSSSSKRRGHGVVSSTAGAAPAGNKPRSISISSTSSSASIFANQMPAKMKVQPQQQQPMKRVMPHRNCKVDYSDAMPHAAKAYERMREKLAARGEKLPALKMNKMKAKNSSRSSRSGSISSSSSSAASMSSSSKKMKQVIKPSGSAKGGKNAMKKATSTPSKSSSSSSRRSKKSDDKVDEVLHMTLEVGPFEVMVTGEKKIEYREYKDRMHSLFVSKENRAAGDFNTFRKYKVVRFKNGYQSNAAVMEVEFKGIRKSKEAVDQQFSNGLHVKLKKGVTHYEIDLGKVLKVENYDKEKARAMTQKKYFGVPLPLKYRTSSAMKKAAMKKVQPGKTQKK
ncbi:unnamed protein product [Amoebophrya sp. A120]|nr:unnamed protein product [Amoebophrya sp. A120]|eukprot:GSA120T00014067001.1